MTMASLLHVDRDGVPLLPALIEASGLATADWLRRYLRAYLWPLVHCYYAHDLVFMPHGENLVMVMKDHVPVRMIMKDIGEESALFDNTRKFPDNMQRLVMDFPDDLKTLAVFIDIFDGFFRFMNQLLVENGCCSEAVFWGAVADCIAGYQAEHPAARAKYERYDLFAETFRQSCLNRLQMGNNTQMINLSDPSANLKIVGDLVNPISRFRPLSANPPAPEPAAVLD
jgi:siderophore synthetase component